MNLARIAIAAEPLGIPLGGNHVVGLMESCARYEVTVSFDVIDTGPFRLAEDRPPGVSVGHFNYVNIDFQRLRADLRFYLAPASRAADTPGGVFACTDATTTPYSLQPILDSCLRKVPNVTATTARDGVTAAYTVQRNQLALSVAETTLTIDETECESSSDLQGAPHRITLTGEISVRHIPSRLA